MSKTFWKWNNAVEGSDSELVIEGVVSDETWWGDEATPKDLRDELARHSGDLTVSINSGGGDVFAGVAMYNALMEYKGNVTVRVDGLAASIASVIAMAGDKIIMSPGSMMMIHKPWTMAVGDANEMGKVKEILDSIENSILPIYETRTGLSREEVVALLEAETWMTAEEAVDMGFADELVEAKKKTSFADSLNALKAFNSQLAVSMSATKKSLEDLELKLEEEDKVETPEAPATPETPVVEAPVVEAPVVEEPKVEEPTAPTEEENKVVDKKKETVNMSKQDEAASAAVVAAVPEQVEAPQQTVKDYLKTKESMGAFARILEQEAGKTSQDVKAAWKEHLSTKLGITNPEIFLPEAVVTEIEDAFKEGGQIWNRVFKTGSMVFKAAWDNQDDVSSNDGRGRGYNRADAADKAEQVLEFETRELRPQFVYKYITLNKEDIKEQRDTGALVRYVLSELPKRIVRELERAIVIGDGRASDDDYKIKKFTAIVTDAAANNVFASEYTPADGEGHYESVLRARDEIEAEGSVVLISRKGYMTDMLLERNDSGGLVFAPGTDLLNVLRLDANIEPDWFEEQDDYDAVLAVLSGYKTVGDTSIEAFTNFILKTNKQEFLQEIYVGGGLTAKKAAVAIVAEATS